MSISLSVSGGSIGRRPGAGKTGVAGAVDAGDAGVWGSGAIFALVAGSCGVSAEERGAGGAGCSSLLGFGLSEMPIK